MASRLSAAQDHANYAHAAQECQARRQGAEGSQADESQKNRAVDLDLNLDPDLEEELKRLEEERHAMRGKYVDIEVEGEGLQAFEISSEARKVTCVRVYAEGYV